jgi:hypothetical protein
VYTSLPEDVRPTTVVFGRNYGQAGALEYYSHDYDLPPVISSHNNYWIWGWDELDTEYNTVIILGGDANDHLYYLEEVELAGVIQCRYCMPYESNLPVYVGRGLKGPLKDFWDEAKHYE